MTTASQASIETTTLDQNYRNIPAEIDQRVDRLSHRDLASILTDTIASSLARYQSNVAYYEGSKDFWAASASICANVVAASAR